MKTKKQKFHQLKEPISIKNIDINKMIVSNKISYGKKGFKYLIGYKNAKKIEPCAYFSQTWMHTEKTLIKLNIYHF